MPLKIPRVSCLNCREVVKSDRIDKHQAGRHCEVMGGVARRRDAGLDVLDGKQYSKLLTDAGVAFEHAPKSHGISRIPKKGPGGTTLVEYRIGRGLWAPALVIRACRLTSADRLRGGSVPRPLRVRLLCRANAGDVELVNAVDMLVRISGVQAYKNVAELLRGVSDG